MALRIFRRKPDNPDNPLPPPAGDRTMRPAGDRPDEPAVGTEESGREPLETQWRPGGGLTQVAEDEAHGLARRAPGRTRGGSPRVAVRKASSRPKGGRSQKAKGAKRAGKRTKQATNRKPASKRAKKGRGSAR